MVSLGRTGSIAAHVEQGPRLGLARLILPNRARQGGGVGGGRQQMQGLHQAVVMVQGHDHGIALGIPTADDGHVRVCLLYTSRCV